MHKNHIERLKSKIREMEVTSLASKARLKASEDRLEQQQRTIDSNAVLLQTLQAQHFEQQQRTSDSKAALLETLRNAQAEKVSMNVTLENNSVLLQTVQAEHAALQVVHVRQQVVLAQSQTEMSKSRRFQPYPSTSKTRHNRCKQVLGNIRDSGVRQTKDALRLSETNEGHTSFVFPLVSWLLLVIYKPIVL